MGGQRVGYVRVSTLDQSTARQLDGLALERTFVDKASGKDVCRPGLEAMVGFVVTVTPWSCTPRGSSPGASYWTGTRRGPS